MADDTPSTSDTPTATPKSDGYLVLARKYRPRTFDDLIGQEPMVRTLRNAFETGRVPQAWMLTGVRGVGKTTTARILARALNYEVPGEVVAPTVDMPKLGTHCQAIMDSRHVDVIEMDAASHTGIDDIRDITDAARYKPASARYKVYIIDEVHMLSKAAFNGLLKTLEEPPPHVKFVFATTEIRKVPVTVLSRCQRFDLRRIEMPVLTEFLTGICDSEEVEAEIEALAAIARAGEGSVRDALSILDQAIAHGAGHVTMDAVSAMLGLIDQTVVIDLFEHLMAGRAREALEGFDALYGGGAIPETVVTDILGTAHAVSQSKIYGSAEVPGMPKAVTDRIHDLAGSLGMGQLSLAWQVLFNGLSEVQSAANPKQAADMVFIRLAYAATLPSPGDLAAKARENPTATKQPTSPSAPVMDRPKETAPVAEASDRVVEDAPTLAPDPGPVQSAPPPQPGSFNEVVELARAEREPMLTTQLERYVRLVSFEPGHIEVELLENADKSMVNRLSTFLGEITGSRWMVSVGRGATAPTIQEERARKHAERVAEARADPHVRKVLDGFPGAEIVKVTDTGTNCEDTADDEPNRTPQSRG